MTYYDRLFEIAADNHGIVTSAMAFAAGIPRKELVRLAHAGKLEHVGHGVYRYDKWINEEWDGYAEAVAIVGKDAYLWGQSVL